MMVATGNEKWNLVESVGIRDAIVKRTEFGPIIRALCLTSSSQKNRAMHGSNGRSWDLPPGLAPGLPAHGSLQPEGDPRPALPTSMAHQQEAHPLGTRWPRLARAARPASTAGSPESGQGLPARACRRCRAIEALYQPAISKANPGDDVGKLQPLRRWDRFAGISRRPIQNSTV